jgi:hypothetical protein
MGSLSKIHESLQNIEYLPKEVRRQRLTEANEALQEFIKVRLAHLSASQVKQQQK